jgi:cytochrome c oxidase subunit 4
MAAHSKKEYFIIFILLTVLTGIEVGITYMGLGRGLQIAGLILLALAKATLVAMFYMHLKSETRSLKLVIGIPMLFPALYAVVLVVEAIARAVATKGA